jgi:uncharacterized glyoxalase superfamily protein PhnB
MAVAPVPEGYHNVQPYLIVNGAKDLLEFIKNVFGATQSELMQAPDGSKVMHAEVKIGDSTVMMSDAQGPWQPMPAAMYVYVPNVDDTYKKMLAAGGTSVMEPADQFYGDRHGGVKDRWGNFWWIATRVENVSREELSRRAEEYMAKQKQMA